jgi:predicted DNA-binding protein (MmcQ/YjbR family)
MDLDKLRELCMSFPGATEGIKWEDHICFMVAEKMFCITGDFGGANLKCSLEDFEELTEREGIIPAPYMARNLWIKIDDFSRLKDKEWKEYARKSYELVRAKPPKKVQQSL